MDGNTPSQKAVDRLNQTASSTRTSPRKRRRLDDDHLSSDIVPASITKTETYSLRRSPRKSVSKLQTPTVVRATRPSVVSNDITDHPPLSPNLRKTQEDDLMKKVLKRKRNLHPKGKADKSPTFDWNGQQLDLNVKGVSFDSHNSPAKDKKGRKPSLGRRSKAHPIRRIRKDVSREANNVTQRSEKLASARDLLDRPDPSTEQENESSDVEDEREDIAVNAEETGQRIRSNAQETKKSRKANRDSNVQTSTQSNNDARQKERSPSPSQSAEKAKKLFDGRKDEFGRGIEVQAEVVGGLETWRVMGAGASTIEATMEDGTLEMGTGSANSVWKLLEYLTRAFQRLNDLGNDYLNDEETAQNTIERLKKKCTLNYLRPEGDRHTPGDPTVLKLYQIIIPKLVHLLKSVLQGRFVDGFSREAVEELLSLVEIGVELCKIAMEWTPKPSKLPSEVRRAVHNHINPNLRVIKLWLADRKQYEEYRAIQQKVRTNLALAQKNNRERKQKLWAERQRRLASHTYSVNGLHQRPSSSADIVDIDELD